MLPPLRGLLGRMAASPGRVIKVAWAASGVWNRRAATNLPGVPPARGTADDSDR